MKTNKEYFVAKRQELSELVRDKQMRLYYPDRQESEIDCHVYSQVGFDLTDGNFYYHEWNWVMLKDYEFFNPKIDDWPAISHFSVQIHP